MLPERVKRQLQSGGYREVPVGKQPYYLMMKKEEIGYAAFLLKDSNMFQGQLLQMNVFLTRICAALEEQYSCPFRMLVLAVSEDVKKDRWMTESSIPVWLIGLSGRPVIFENQPGTFGNVEKLLEKKVYPWTGIITENGFIPWVTLVLAAVNLAVQIVVAWQETGGRESGLLYAMVLQIGDFCAHPEYYRLLTSAFLHFGWQHLFNNMLVLLFLGRTAERIAGRGKFLAAYLICAVGANAASAVWYGWNGQTEVYTAGASGAVFGVAGMLLFFVLMNKGRLEQVSTRQLIWMMAFTVYHGFAESGINNCAHITGGILGFVCGFLIWFVCLRERGAAKL